MLMSSWTKPVDWPADPQHNIVIPKNQLISAVVSLYLCWYRSSVFTLMCVLCCFVFSFEGFFILFSKNRGTHEAFAMEKNTLFSPRKHWVPLIENQWRIYLCPQHSAQLIISCRQKKTLVCCLIKGPIFTVPIYIYIYFKTYSHLKVSGQSNVSHLQPIN